MTIRTACWRRATSGAIPELFQELKRRFRREVVAGNGRDFVEAKLAERDERHQRMGNSRYALEPNIKEGKGGLRDLHTLFWIAKYLYQVDEVAALVERGVLTAAEVATFEKAAAFLWTVRCHLHYLAGRPEERLTFDLQPELARRMGYTDHAGTPRRRAADEALLPDRQERRRPDAHLLRRPRGGPAAQAVLPAARLISGIGLRRREIEGFRRRRRAPHRRRTPELFTSSPVNILRLFEVAQRHDLDIHPHGLAPGHAASAAGRSSCAAIPRPTACSWRC